MSEPKGLQGQSEKNKRGLKTLVLTTLERLRMDARGNDERTERTRDVTDA